MEVSQFYLSTSIIVLIVIMIALVSRRKKMREPLSKLASFAFCLIVVGIVFGKEKVTGYSLIGVGIIFAIIDIVRKLEKSSPKGD